MNTKFFSSIRLIMVLLGLFLLACQPQNNQVPQKTSIQPKNVVILKPDSPKHAYIKEKIVELKQYPLLDSVTGKITYDETRTVRISSPIAGRVVGAISNLGANVQLGDALAELDSPDLGKAQSEYATAMATLKSANNAFKRTEELYENDVAPRKALEGAEESLIRAHSESQRAQLKLKNLGVPSGSMDNRFILHAPFSGVITERNINPGMEVRPDLTSPLFVISDLSKLWVQMDIFEKDIGKIHVGQEVLMHVSAYPEESFTATVSYISQVVDETTRTVKARCVFQNPETRLLPSMFASIKVLSDPDELVVVVPLTALFTEGESDWLYVNIGDYQYQKRPVKTGLRLKGHTVILEGLHQGEHLVVDGALLLRAEEDAVQQKGRILP
ncbi:MAG: efflux RND transporter periplasmic adaptor subunit [Nitrosomonadales bacterium]|nr:MAG: efflux RND transporter periplasmic adaptor subunit [Nitrosomonadales bacterium]